MNVLRTTPCGFPIIDSISCWHQEEGEKFRGDGVNAVENQKPIGFYLGDDCLKDFKEKAPHLPAQMEKLRDYGVRLEDGTHIRIELFLGGDLKFLNAMLGITNNASMYYCPFCITHKNLTDLPIAELEKKTMASHLQWVKDQVADLEQQLQEVQGTGAKAKTTHKKLTQQITQVQSTPAVVYLGPRTVQMQQELAHVSACQNCPGYLCGQPVEANQQILERTADQRATRQQHHYSTLEGDGPYLNAIALDHVMADTLHIILRVVPVVYRATVSAHVSKPEGESIAQWVFDVHRVIISSETGIQNRTGKTTTIGTESWPGPTCDKMMNIFYEVLRMAHTQGDNLRDCEVVWEYLIDYQKELLAGCVDDNDDAERKAHGDRLQHLAEVFVNAFKQVASAERVTPYMHVMLIDIPRQARQHGGLVKFCCQGVERLHQWVHFISQWRCNKHHDTTARTLLQKLTMQGDQDALKPKRSGVKKKTIKKGRAKAEAEREMTRQLVARKREVRDGDPSQGQVRDDRSLERHVQHKNLRYRTV